MTFKILTIISASLVRVEICSNDKEVSLLIWYDPADKIERRKIAVLFREIVNFFSFIRCKISSALKKEIVKYIF